MAPSRARDPATWPAKDGRHATVCYKGLAASAAARLTVSGLIFCLCFLTVPAYTTVLNWIWPAAIQRSYELERTNLGPQAGRYTDEEYAEMMLAIARESAVGPFGNQATLRAFLTLPRPPASILEIGPGSGDFARLLGVRFPSSSILGIDSSEQSLRVATFRGVLDPAPPPNVRFELREAAELTDPPDSYEVITSTFLNHEIFPDAAFVKFLRQVRVVGSEAYIFNDFVRSVGCLSTFGLMRSMSGRGRWLLPGAWLPRGWFRPKWEAIFALSPNAAEMVVDGALLSVKRSFTVAEYKSLFREAGYPDEALTCNRHDGWRWGDFLGIGCRVTCVANLTKNRDATT